MKTDGGHSQDAECHQDGEDGHDHDGDGPGHLAPFPGGHKGQGTGCDEEHTTPDASCQETGGFRGAKGHNLHADGQDAQEHLGNAQSAHDPKWVVSPALPGMLGTAGRSRYDPICGGHLCRLSNTLPTTIIIIRRITVTGCYNGAGRKSWWFLAVKQQEQ